ncbi:MAG: endonuclease/exonuclease/phosphatase family protein [Gammaproteobacteria bacterium]|jgi:endonuclease/exonuclease/phosphatase family metal-dependent hydrolase
MTYAMKITRRWLHNQQMRITAAGLLASVLSLQGCATADLRSPLAVRSFEVPVESAVPVESGDYLTLRVMTLNVAHGRGEAFHQLLQKSDTIVQNLNEISAMLKREQPDVLALQEADAPSFWSGNFHHVDYLATQASFSSAVNGTHVDGPGLAYGTALLATTDLRHAESVTFNPDLALTPKGFVVSTVDWPGQPHVQVDVVSLHLDFASENTRRQQALELIGFMRDRNRHMIVMGDFNADWGTSEATVRLIASELALNAYDPDGKGQATFPDRNKRLDWILVSSGIEFREYQVVSDAVSDHRGVIAELGLGTQLVKNALQ